MFVCLFVCLVVFVVICYPGVGLVFVWCCCCLFGRKRLLAILVVGLLGVSFVCLFVCLFSCWCLFVVVFGVVVLVFE